MTYIKTARTWICGALCHYGLRVYSEVWIKKSWTSYCPLCNSEFKLNDDFYLVINNSKMFPNSLIHAKCIVEKSSVDGLIWLNFNKATEAMYENYRTFKETYRSWIRE